MKNTMNDLKKISKYILQIFSIICLLFIFSLPVKANDWTQDAYDAQRTGYTPEEPEEPWTLLWTWNGPNSVDGDADYIDWNDHFYDYSTCPPPFGELSYNRHGTGPWEARTVTGGQYIYVPACTHGLYALKKTDGTIAWNFNQADFY